MIGVLRLAMSISALILALLSCYITWSQNERLACENAMLRGEIAGYQEEIVHLQNQLKIKEKEV